MWTQEHVSGTTQRYGILLSLALWRAVCQGLLMLGHVGSTHFSVFSDPASSPTKALNTLSLGSNSSRHFLFCSGRKRFHVFRHIASCQELLFLSPFIHQQEVPKAVADHQHFVDINKLVSADELILFHLYFMNSRKSCRNNHVPPRKYVTFVIEYRSTLNCEKYKCFPAQSYHLEPRVFKEMRKHGKFRKHWKENQSIVPIPQEKRHK